MRKADIPFRRCRWMSVVAFSLPVSCSVCTDGFLCWFVWHVLRRLVNRLPLTEIKDVILSPDDFVLCVVGRLKWPSGGVVPDGNWMKLQNFSWTTKTLCRVRVDWLESFIFRSYSQEFTIYVGGKGILAVWASTMKFGGCLAVFAPRTTGITRVRCFWWFRCWWNLPVILRGTMASCCTRLSRSGQARDFSCLGRL